MRLCLPILTAFAACLSLSVHAAPSSKTAEEVRAEIAKAREGSDFALVSLEQMRRAGVPNAPSLDEIVAIETARAEKGDAVTAWRLAQRYEFGDGVEASASEMIRWLRVAAKADAYPKARDAAYRLCEAYGRGEAGKPNEAEAHLWCREASDAGHAGAAMVIARLSSKASD